MKAILMALFLSLSFNVMAEDYDDFSEYENDVVVQGNKKGLSSLLFWFNPVRVKVDTELTQDQIPELVETMRYAAAAGEFRKFGINTGYIETKIKDNYAKITMFTNSLGSNKKAATVRIRLNEEKLGMSMRLRYSHTKSLYKTSGQDGRKVGRWEFSNEVEDDLELALKNVAAFL